MVKVYLKKIIKKIPGGSGNDPEAGGDNSGGDKLFGGVSDGGGRSKFNRQLQKCLLIVLSLVLMSCSVKHDAPAVGTNLVKGITAGLKVDPNADSDGDGVKDQDEINQGRNPFVAEIPELKVKFLQNYKIEVFYHP